MFPPADSCTAQGVDESFGVNCLAHFFLTKLLLLTLLAWPFKAQGFPRVMNTSSSGSYWYTEDPKNPSN